MEQVRTFVDGPERPRAAQASVGHEHILVRFDEDSDRFARESLLLIQRGAP